MAVALAAGCDSELCEPLPNPADGGMVYLKLDVPQIEETVVSRAAADDPDNVIYSAQVFVFDADGGLIEKKQLYNEYAARKPYDTSQALGISVRSGEQYKNCSIYLFANVAIWDAAPVGAYNFDAIQTLDDLKRVYSYRNLQSALPETRDHRPMVGSVENVDLTQATSVGDPHRVEMKRVLAKINFRITVNADFSFYFTGWSVGNMPRYTLAVPQQTADGKPLDFADSKLYDESGLPYKFYFPDPSNPNEVNKTTIAVPNPEWITGGSSEPVSFFMYENRRGTRAEANWDNVQGTLQGVGLSHTDATGTDPRFKTLYAPANASYIVVKGLIKKNRTDQDAESVRSFSYKIALGGNNTDDYNVERNHSYTYNLRINGMTDNDVSVTVEDFDSRAHRGYGIHIAAPNIDRIDAHYDKRYINVTATPGTIDFALYETLTEAQAPGGQPMDNSASWVKLSTMDTFNIDIDPDEATTKTLDFDSTRPNRFLCLYTQENATKQVRKAVLKISHTVQNADDLPPQGADKEGEVKMEIVRNSDGTATVNYYYDVIQAGLLPVTMKFPEDLKNPITFYVESFEEYKMAIDPTYTSQVEGMPWGWSIETNASGAVTTYYDFENGVCSAGSLGTAVDHREGLPNTQAIVGAEGYGAAFPGAVPSAEFSTEAHVEELYKNYAARYCYNKNKRDADGNIVGEPAWYLPAYEELCALTADNAFAAPSGWEPFAANTGIYWSSTVPTKDEVKKEPVDEGWYHNMNDLPLFTKLGFWLLTELVTGNGYYPNNASKWGEAIWEMISKDMIAEGDDYEYRNVAKAVKKGVLQKERKTYTTGYNNTYYFDLFTPRKSTVINNEPINVRAVRKAEGVEVE